MKPKTYDPRHFGETITVSDTGATPVLTDVQALVLSNQYWMQSPWKDIAFAIKAHPDLLDRSLIGYLVTYQAIDWTVNGVGYYNGGQVLLLSCTIS